MDKYWTSILTAVLLQVTFWQLFCYKLHFDSRFVTGYILTAVLLQVTFWQPFSSQLSYILTAVFVTNYILTTDIIVQVVLYWWYCTGSIVLLVLATQGIVFIPWVAT